MRNRFGAPRCCLLVLVATLLAASAAWAQQPDSVGRRIVAIEFECAEPIDLSGLRRLMPMRVGDELRPEYLDEARWRLAQKEIFTSMSVDSQPRGDGVAVIIRLVRKPIVNRIVFRGNDAIGDKELRRIVRLRESMALTEELLDYSVRRLHDRYVAEGFAAAHITGEVGERSPGEVDVIFRITEGEPVRVRAIVIEGHVTIPEADIRRAVHVRVGDRYVRERQRDAEKAIVRLFREKSYYEVQVNTSWEGGEGETGTLRFKIDPGPPFTVTFTGNEHFSDEKLLRLMDLPKRPIVTDGTWRELARRAQRTYQEAGYYFARVDLKIEPGSPKTVHFNTDEGPRMHIGAVYFEGNHGLSERQLRAPLATRPPSWIPWRRGVLLDDVLDDDLKRLWSLYRRHGYEAVRIMDARTRFDRERGKIFVTIVVEEGPQTIVRTVERSGVAPIAKSLPEFSVRVGDPLDADKVGSDRQALLTAFAGAGYTYAEVTTHVTTTPAGTTEAAAVRFDAKPHEQQRVGTIIVQNNIDTHAEVITRELPFRTGDPLDPRALLRGQSSIFKLGLFRSVTVRPLEEKLQPPPAAGPHPAEGEPLGSEPWIPASSGPSAEGGAPAGPPEAEPDQHPVMASVSEKPPGTLQWGAGYNTRDGFRGFVEVSDDNLQGLGRRVSLRGECTLQPGDFIPNEYLGNLGFREPHLDGTKWTFRSNLIAQRSTVSVNEFSFERLALVPALERTIIPGLQAGADLELEEANIFDLAPDVIAFNPRDQGHLRTFSLGPFAVYDGRDDAFVPRRGLFDSLRMRLAPGPLGSDIPFFKLLAQHTQYVPLDDDMTFVYAGRTGWAVPFNHNDIIPIRERFFLGGRTTVRGFSENQIGPKGTLHNPLGGDLVIALNTELRFPLVYGFGGVVFVDGGGVYLQDQSVSLHDFRRSTGLGLRYITPVGPVSLDYGFKLDRRADESLGEVHFSIGTIF